MIAAARLLTAMLTPPNQRSQPLHEKAENGR